MGVNIGDDSRYPADGVHCLCLGRVTVYGIVWNSDLFGDEAMAAFMGSTARTPPPHARLPHSAIYIPAMGGHTGFLYHIRHLFL